MLTQYLSAPRLNVAEQNRFAQSSPLKSQRKATYAATQINMTHYGLALGLIAEETTSVSTQVIKMSFPYRLTMWS